MIVVIAILISSVVIFIILVISLHAAILGSSGMWCLRMLGLKTIVY